MLSLLVATLIGVFITPDGIVVGADTALSNVSGRVANQQKYCVTGSRAVATLQGSYQIEDSVTKASIGLYDRFRELCTQMESLSLGTVREQALYIANALRADLATFLERLPPEAVVQNYTSNRVVARISVTGYDSNGPDSVVIGLGIATIDPEASKWEAQVSPLIRLSFSSCGVRFHGQEGVVSAVRTDTGVRISRKELEKPSVAKLSAFMRGNCSDASRESAAGMFVEAMRLTVTLGPGFGIPKDAVSLPVDVVVIPRDGAVEVRHIESW
jgi:hypothetical protein